MPPAIPPDALPPFIAPAANAREYLFSDGFARLIESVAREVQARHPALSLEVAGAVGLVWDWFVRKSAHDPRFLSGGRFPDERAMRAYLRHALWHAAANEVRKSRRARLEPLADQWHPRSDSTPLNDARLLEMLDGLPEPDGTIVREMFFGEQPLERIAERLGLSLGATKQRFVRACGRLAERYG